MISSLLLVSKKIYRWSIKRSSHVNTTGATSGARTVTLPEYLNSPPGVSGVRVARSFVDHCLSFFFWPLNCRFTTTGIHLVSNILLSDVFAFWVPYCDVCYEFRISTMFGSSLPPVVCTRDIVFACACLQWCPAHIVLCYLFCLSSSCVLCTLCFQVLWIVHSWLPLRFSLTFI